MSAARSATWASSRSFGVTARISNMTMRLAAESTRSITSSMAETSLMISSRSSGVDEGPVQEVDGHVGDRVALVPISSMRPTSPSRPGHWSASAAKAVTPSCMARRGG